jgi:hypothetical protein
MKNLGRRSDGRRFGYRIRSVSARMFVGYFRDSGVLMRAISRSRAQAKAIWPVFDTRDTC